MNRPPPTLNRPTADRRARIAVRLLAGLGLTLLAGWGTVRAGDILRGGAPVATTGAPLKSGGSATVSGAPLTTPSQDRLARTTQALEAVKQMQTAARNLAISGPNNLRAGLPAVPVNSYGQANGLRPATGTDKLWIGANQPVQTTQTTGGTSSTNVTIKQLQQQALLTWESFNVGKSTTLTYDQAAGGANAGQWIAFNYVRDPSGAPSQILGSIKTIGLPDAKGVEQVGGQVYVMNANGIIFGGSSQVNVHALTASSLPINYNLIQRGILNNPDGQFLFTALPQAAGSKGPTPEFDPAVATEEVGPAQTPFTVDGRFGDVEVQAGAQLTAPTNTDRVGGRIALVGPNVTNTGTITTPDGQTILAAGLQVGLDASDDPSLRGLNVYVGAVSDPLAAPTVTVGTVTNNRIVNSDGTSTTGLISAPRAAVTLAGRKVNQLGFIDSSTSVALNGRVDLLAEYNAFANPSYSPEKSYSLFLRQSTDTDVSTGTVTLGPGSVIQILPELASTERVVGTQLTLPSEINLRGLAVHLASTGTESNAATLIAPSGQVGMEAGRWVSSAGNEAFIHTEGQVYLDAGAAVDVGGAQGVEASVTENIVTVELRGPQLADSPLQREGPLRGQTVQVDLRQTGTYQGRAWVGTPLADATGYIGLVQRTVGQLSTAGGSVNIAAGGSVVLNKNSTVNVGGGWIDFQGGNITTTKVVASGQIFDISKATPDRSYDGIYNATTTTIDPKWGVVQTSTNPLAQGTYESGYRQGGSGGSVTISAPAMALDGNLYGHAVAGPKQRTAAGQLARTFADPALAAVLPALQAALARPDPGALNLQFVQQYQAGELVFEQSLTPPTIRFSSTGSPTPVTPVEAFPAESTGKLYASLGDRGLKGAPVWLAPNLISADPTLGGGFGSLAISNSEGDILIQSNLTLPAGGSLTLDAANITVSSNVAIKVPAGNLGFTAHNLSPYTYAFNLSQNIFDLPVPDPKRGVFTLGGGALLSTAGLVVDERTNSRTGPGDIPFLTNGYRLDRAAGSEVESILIRAYRVGLANGSTLDVSGGVTAGATGKMTYGNAGKISIYAVLDPQGQVNLPIGQDPVNPANTPDLRGYLQMNPDLVTFKGYAGQGARSGGLTLQAQMIQIDNPLARTGPAAQALFSPANLVPTRTLRLSPDFFNQGGFGSFSLIGLGEAAREANGDLVLDPLASGLLYVPGIYVAPTLTAANGQSLATTIAPQVANWQTVIPSGNGGQITLQKDPNLLPLGARSAASVKLSATGINYTGAGNPLFARGDLIFGTGASIELTPKGSVSLAGNTVQLYGQVVAPAGTIDVIGGGAFVGSDITEEALPTVVLGAQSRLRAAGAIIGPAGQAVNPGILGNTTTGSVLAGGKITVQGNIVAAKNAEMDVSGAAGSLDLLPAYSGSSAKDDLVATPVASDGGTISLKGTQLLVTNATLKGAAGGPSAQGGSLSLSSGRFSIEPVLPSDINLEVTQAGPVLPASGLVLGRPVVDADDLPISSQGHFAASDFWNAATKTTTGGFGALTLEGNLQFAGPVNLGATRSLTLGTGGVIYSVPRGTETSQDIVLQAPSVALGLPFQPPVPTGPGSIPPVSIFKDISNAPFYVAPQPGPGTLSVKAESLISLGSVSLQGISAASFATEKNGQAVAGDIRGNGTLDIAGSFDFTAGQIYPPTAVSFTVAAYDYTDTEGELQEGSVTFHPVRTLSGAAVPPPALPLSAGGQLSVYATNITQGGVLRAPLGVINLGWNGVGNPPSQTAGAPVDLLVGSDSLPIPTAGTLTVAKGSVTSVSAVDPGTGQKLTIPYGYSPEGTTWVDPAGTDITTVGPPRKEVNLSALDVVDEEGSSIDISGGGDLYAFRWIPGVGGTRDILDPSYVANPAAPSLYSYAVLPGFEPAFAPYAPFGTAVANSGYTAGTGLAVGDRIHLDLNNGQGAKDYTLLPARYALFPGAYLVTAVGGVPPATPVIQANGTIVVGGYRTNSFAATPEAPLRTAFEVAVGTAPETAPTPPATPVKSIVRTRAQYDDFRGNAFFAQSALAANLPVWRLPVDSGYLLLTSAAGGTIKFDGAVAAKPQAGSSGRGGVVDIDSPSDILIASSQDSAEAIAGKISALLLTDPLVLDAATLNGFGAESLLIGGFRTAGETGTNVQVSSDKLAVSNSGETLQGSDIILAANTSLQLDAGAVIVPSGTLSGADELVFGQLNSSDVAVAGSGNGVMVRVTSDAAAQSNRLGVDQSTAASLVVGAGAQIGSAGGTTGSITLDSTRATTLDPSVKLSGAAIALGSGQISLQFAGAGALRTQADGEVTQGLVLSPEAIRTLETSAKTLSLLSYSSVDLYGSGELGNATFAQIALHTPEIMGDGGEVTFRAKEISLDNISNSAAADATASPAAGGQLKFTSDTFRLGSGTVAVNHYESLAVEAATGVIVGGTGGLATQGDLTVTTPLVTGATAADQKISAGGILTIAGTAGTVADTNLGARLVLEGRELAVGSLVRLSSGNLTLHATGAGPEGGIEVSGILDVSGSEQKFYDLPKYTHGGQVSLISDHGDIAITEDGIVNVSGAKSDPADPANSGTEYASQAGTLAIGTTGGNFGVEGKVLGQGRDSTQGGAFTLDAGSIALSGPVPSLTPLEEALGEGGFTRSQSIRVRTGDVVIDDGITAHAFELSADQGSILVAADGVIDASGGTGGSITLAARGSVTVDSGARLTVQGDSFNAAGKGGAVRLEAGTPLFNSAGVYVAPAPTAAVDMRGTVDLSVGRESIDLLPNVAVQFPAGTPGGGKVAFTAAGTYTVPGGIPVSFAPGQAVSLPKESKVVLTGAGVASFAGSGDGGSIPVVLADGGTVALKPVRGSAAGLAAVLADAALGRNTGTLHLRAPQVDVGGQPIPAGNTGTAGTDLAVKPITGSIVDASRVVVEGYKVFVPVGGSIDTVVNSVAVNGQAFVNQTGTISSRLLSGVADPAARTALAAVLHVRPGAELVNAANPGVATQATITASTTNTTINLVEGGSFTLGALSAAAGKIVTTSTSGRILLADGTSLVLAATDRNINVPAGSTVVLDKAGTITLGITRTGTGAGSGTLVLAAGASLTGTNPVSFNAAAGTNLVLNSAGTSAVTVPGATPVVLINGGRVRFSSSGSISSPSGLANGTPPTPFAAGATVTVAAGSMATLNSAGTITFSTGSLPIQLALSGGSYATTGTGSNTLNTGPGDLTLTNDWNLAANRYLPTPSSTVGVPQMLTLRAAGNLILNGALSDGFATAAYDAPLLTDGSHSASYRLVAGADLAAADFRRVQPLASLGVATGSLQLGRIGFGSTVVGANALTRNYVSGRYQVVRTGTGDIDVATGRDVLLLNQFAGIYTAGIKTPDPTLADTFDVPVLEQNQFSSGRPLGSTQQTPSYPVQYSLNGGDLVIHAQGDIARKTKDNFGRLQDDSQQQLPSNWLYRRGIVDPATGNFFQGAVDPNDRKLVQSDTGEVMSTTWWVDFSNFFEGFGTLGGGNLTLSAGRDIMNVDAVVPTNARMAGKDSEGVLVKPDAANLVELGGGNLAVKAGRDINGGVFYVERGQGSLAAGRNILTNATRTYTRVTAAPETWLPTTLFLGKGNFAVSAHADLRLGPVANPFLFPAGISNTAWSKSYFSTYSPDNAVEVTSLTGSVLLSENSPNPILYSWYNSVLLFNSANASNSRPWLRLNENSMQAFATSTVLAPATLRVTTYAGDLDIAGNLALAPSPQGTLELAVAGSINGLTPQTNSKGWAYSTVRLLDSDPGSIPGISEPLATVSWSVPTITFVSPTIYAGIDGLFQEREQALGDSLQTKLSRHAAGPLHAADLVPLRIYATDGDISGLSLLAGKSARILASDDISDISLTLQNNRASDISVIAAGRDIAAYAPNSPLRQAALATAFVNVSDKASGKSGQIEIGGPGALEVLAGRNLDLGVDPNNAALGITSIGSARNPNLPFGGAEISVAAGLGGIYTPTASGQLRAPGFLSTSLGFSRFVEIFLKPGTTNGDRYLPVLAAALGLPATTPLSEVAAAVAPEALTEAKALALLEIYQRVLRDSARDRNNPDSPTFGKYTNGFAAIAALFPGSPEPTEADLNSTVPVVRPAGPWTGSLSLSTKEIKTAQGGDIMLLVPGGTVTVGRATDAQKADQGILTERGGAISIFAADSVNVGTSRIFTLRGGDEIVWSTWGNVAAGSGSKTVFSAPPTRVLVDPQSGDVQTDLAGLATGAGIGVLATLSGVKPGDVDLIAPVGTIDAGDAGIRSSGNLNLAARVVLNASNTKAGGATSGAPPPPPVPNIGALSAAATASAGSSTAATEVTKQASTTTQVAELPSLISVEVLGYGGEDEADEEEQKKEGEAATAVTASL